MRQEKEKSPGTNGAEKLRHHHRSKLVDCPQLDFKAALDAAGFPTKTPIIPDGKLHRFHIEGDKPGNKNGWYVLYGDGLPSGAFGSWKTGFKGTWCEKTQHTFSQAERDQFRQRMAVAQKARDLEELTRWAEARNKASSIWKTALPVPQDYPYLVRKNIGNHGLRLYKTSLVIPMRDSTGNLHSLQFIDGEGNKRFLSGGRKKGCYFAIGKLADSLCIAEGYATAASIYEATGIATAVAFDAGNLEAVALALRAKFQKIEITLCADNDAGTPGNPGLTKAREAAAACGALLAVPPIAGDFNDLIQQGFQS